jgi:hypothetical protein
VLIERTKNRGRKQHNEAEGRRRKTAALATVCHHRCLSRRLDHRHRRSAFLPPSSSFSSSSPLFMHEQWAWIIIHVHCSCNSGLRPRFVFEPGLARFQKLSKKYFRKNLWFPRVFFY